MNRFLWKIFRVILATASAVAIFSCGREPDPEVPVGDVSFEAYSDYFEFAAGDKIAVLGAEKPFIAAVEGDKVRFIGDVMHSDEYYAVYPYSAFRYFSPTEPSVAVMNLPTLQKAVKNEVPRERRLSIGHASDNDRRMTFNEKVSYLKFTIGPGSGNIRSISLVSDSSPLSGDFSVLCDGGYDTYPMPGSAYNVCLASSGNYLEEGDYYVAFRYVNSLSLDIAFEDEDGRIALKSTSLSSYEPGQIVDMGTVAGLTFQYRDVIPSASTIIYRDPVSGVMDIELISSGEVSVNVLEGEDWLSVLQTKSVGLSVFRISYEENTGTSRTGRLEVVGEDGERRVVYTIVQYGSAGLSDETALRKSLSALYESTGGDSWKNNTNWCSELPLSEWYGVTLNQWDDIEGISLYNNGLVGELPEAFDGFETLQRLSLSSNSGLTGHIPSYIYNVYNVDIAYNAFDSLSDVDDPDKAVTNYLYLYDNKLKGPLPEKIPYIPHLYMLNVEDNDFSGAVPESYGKILERGGAIRLNGNSLSGELPESIRRDERFRKSMWTNIMFQEGEGFDFHNVEIYSSFTTGYDMENNPVSVSDYIAEHEYTLYVSLYPDKSLLQEIIGWYEQYKGQDLGVVCYMDMRGYADVSEKYDLPWLFVSLRHNSDAKMLLIDSDDRIMLNPGSADKDDILEFLEAKFGPYEGRVEPEPEPEPEPPVQEPLDGVVTLLQAAQEGNGIDIVLMGDSYEYDAVKDGTYDAVMRETMDYFFEIEPYKSYRHLFNVYAVNVVSGNGSRLGVSYGEGTSISGNDELCFNYAAKALTAERLENALVVVVVNSDRFGGSTYMYTPDGGDWADGKAIAYIPKVQKKMEFRGLVQHEAGGHGFGKLADEYVTGKGDSIPEYEKESKVAYEKYGWYANIDFTDDPEAVKWAHILSDPRYVNEPEGVYEGALEYASGVWRPTYTSIMNDNQGTFNAPSREIIWYRIHKLAYGDSWQYDFEAFAEYDAVNLQPIEY